MHVRSRSTDDVLVSVVIPLFKSAPFLEAISQNISILLQDRTVEIVVSDRHIYDDTSDRLARRFGRQPRVRILQATDALSWVQHTNLLLREGRGRYWHYLPHDDLSPPGAIAALLDALQGSPDAVLSVGGIQAISTGGARLEEQDWAAATCGSWTVGTALRSFWTRRPLGALTGLVRRDKILFNGLYLRGTLSPVHSERAWLFGLSLLGGFAGIGETTLVKRYHDRQSSLGWLTTPETILEAGRILSRYARSQLTERTVREYVLADIAANVESRVAAFQTRADFRYRPLPERGAPGIRSRTLPLVNVPETRQPTGPVTAAEPGGRRNATEPLEAVES